LDLFRFRNSTQPFDPGISGDTSAKFFGLRSVAGDNKTNARGKLTHCFEKYSETLARFVTTEEKNRTRFRFRDRRAGVVREINTVEEKFVGTADRFDCHVASVSGHCATNIDLARQPPNNRLKPSVGSALPRRMKSANDRLRLKQKRRIADSRRKRFMNIHDIEAFVAKCSNRAQLRRRVGGNWSDGSVGSSRKTVAQGRDSGIRWWPIAGTKDSNVVPASTKRSS
jgi:hypothetical protein